ncbi:rho guanine nucleotide exchange factor 17-like [Arctopsyche grandis]|uniref:rho guanine nucleotide exchange factor 17-like n=1 Tax=Arctopsyche grandis TaxID=121162 RepID=UPI00406D9B42
MRIALFSQSSGMKKAGAGYVSVGGVRYGVRLAAAKYSAGPGTGTGTGTGTGPQAPGRGAERQGTGRAPTGCCGQSRAACCRAAPTPALDRLHRLRLGRAPSAPAPTNNNNNPERRRPDKTERLRELTERLMGRAPPPAPPPLPPPRHHRHKPPTPTATQPQRALSHHDAPTHQDTFDPMDIQLQKAEARTIVGSYAQRTIPFRSASFSQVDFNPIDGKYIRNNAKPRLPTVEDASTSGLCVADLTLPRKKDGSPRSISPSTTTTLDAGSTPSIDSAVGSDEGLTVNLPLSRIPTVVPDLSHKHSGTRSLTHPLPGRSASVDSDMSFCPIECGERKSLQYFPDKLREVREESDLSLADSAQAHSDTLSPVESTLESLCPFEFPIPVEQKNKSEPSSSASESVESGENESASGSAIEECSQAQIFIETPEGKILKTATASVIPVPVYECIVKEWSSIPSDQWLNNDEKSQKDQNALEATDDETITSEQVENLLATVQNASKLPPPPPPEERRRVLDKSKRRKGIYITKWPIQDEISGLILPESVISAQFNESEYPDVPNGEIVNLETGNGEVFIGYNNNKRHSRTPSNDVGTLKQSDGPWTGQETACIWSASHDESLSPDGDDQSTPNWPKSLTEPRWNSRPTLTYQSSEEKEDFGGVPKICSKKCNLLARTDSLSEGESESGGLSTPVRDRTASPSPFNPSDLSDSESKCQSGKERCSHVPRRYSKRPLRGPYGQMLEAEMKKPELGKLSKHDEELKFLDELVASPPQRSVSPNVSSSRTSLNSTTSSVGIPEPKPNVVRTRGAGNLSLDDTQLKSSFGLSGSPTQKSVIRSSPKRKVSANIPYSAPNPVTTAPEGVNRVTVFHQRTTSSPSKLEGLSSSKQTNEPKRRPEPSVELLAELLRGSSERISTDTSLDGIPICVQRFNDTRTHVVVELYDTERSYVEALQILVVKYLHPLKSPENVGLVDSALVDEIFYQVPAILALHEVFLDELRKRLESWDVKQKVGDVFLNVFTKPSVMETYTAFINNWKKAKETIKATSASRPAFARFLEAMAREHKGKLSLDNLLIKPVQKFPRYELLIQRLIKHTEPSHPDHQLLINAQKEIHELLVRINCTERESLELEQQQQTLRELESLVEGLANLVSTDRSFLRHDTVSMPSGQGGTKERALFLFSDLLLITSIKRRTGTIRKPSAAACPGSLASTLDANKYKLLMRIPLDEVEILKAKDENLRRIMREMETLTEDVNILTQIADLAAALHCGKTALEDMVREMLSNLSRQLSERQGSDAQLSCMDLAVNTTNGLENLSFIFSKPEKRTSWEEIFNEAKQKIALSDDKRPAPEFVSSVPIRKTRAGLQFTCAAPTLAIGPNFIRDVWVCNSDGYVGQVCVLTLHPEPQVTSCNGVCNARILCVACVPPPLQTKASCGSEVSLTGLNRQNFSNNKTAISISIQDTDEGSQNIRLESSSSSEEDDEGSLGDSNTNENNNSKNSGQTSVNSQNQANTAISQNNSANNQNISVIPVMKSSSNPNVDKTAMGINSAAASPKQSIDESNNCNQPTMWLGTEDGCIHVYNCSDNIRIKKNKVKIQHGSSVHCIVYVENKVFVSLANGDIIVYTRENGSWNEHTSLNVGTVSCPVTKLMLSGGKLWCAQHTNIKIINPNTVQVEDTFSVSCDASKPISHMAISGLGVWVALHNTAFLKCYHANTKEMLTELNIAPAVTKMLAGCDDIIRQHKAACLRVTSLMACRELLWVGTSAGVLLTAPASPPRPPAPPTLCGIPQGHTGHVRFLTVVEATSIPGAAASNLNVANNQKPSVLRRSIHSPNKSKNTTESSTSGQLLVISGGDGYEDFRSSGVSEVAGREDSTNHLLLWRV